MQSWTPTAGTPQGAVISPLLANLYLHPLDVKMSELGYRFEAGRRWVRHKSLKGFKDKVREKTKRTRGESMRTTIDDLTPMIRGWFGYFKHAHPHTFTNLDGLIRRRGGFRKLFQHQVHFLLHVLDALNDVFDKTLRDIKIIPVVISLVSGVMRSR